MVLREKNNLAYNAKLALQIVLNYEEGGENCVLNGDKFSETFLSEVIGAKAIKGRNIIWNLFMNMVQGRFWRIDKLLEKKYSCYNF